MVHGQWFIVYCLGRGNALVATLAKLLPEEKLHLFQGLGLGVHGLGCGAEFVGCSV